MDIVGIEVEQYESYNMWCCDQTKAWQLYYYKKSLITPTLLLPRLTLPIHCAALSNGEEVTLKGDLSNSDREQTNNGYS